MKKNAKNTEKLSFGYKINRAADDAAGLSISEMMRRQIRGLKVDSILARPRFNNNIRLQFVAGNRFYEKQKLTKRPKFTIVIYNCWAYL